MFRGRLAAHFLYLFFTVGVLQCAQAEWHGVKGARWMELPVPAKGRVGFTLLSAEITGVAFRNVLNEADASANRVLPDGAGVAAGDFDCDGLTDLFFASLERNCILYRNLGSWKFEDVTNAAGLDAFPDRCRAAVFADLDGNGTVDLAVSTFSKGVLILLNDGRGHFSDATKAAGAMGKSASMTLALADVDGNGTLDLYVTNNRTEDVRDAGQATLMRTNGKLVVPSYLQSRFRVNDEGRVDEYGEPDILYLNDGMAHFTAVPWTGGTFLDEDGKPLAGPPLDWGLTATFRDLSGDGAPDLYVCNDYWTPDRIWINDGAGRFRAIDRSAIRHTSASSMGVDVADLTRTGATDIFVVDMLSRNLSTRKRQMLAWREEAPPPGTIEDRPQVTRNTLLHGLGDGTFAEVADFAGVSASEWAWQPIFLDVDLDGYEDLLVTAGHVKDVQDLDANAEIVARRKAGTLVPPQPFSLTAPVRLTRQELFTQELFHVMKLYPALQAPIVAYRNRGALRFEEKTAAWGLDTPGVHHGFATADLDGDGDLDLIVNNLNAPAGLYRNTTAAPRVAVRLKGLPPNTQGIGAKVVLRGGKIPMQSHEVVSGGRYLSGSDPLLVFAAGRTNGMKLEVTWRNGTLSIVEDVKPNRLYEIEESGGEPRATRASSPTRQPLFTRIALDHRHHENKFDEFFAEPLLANRFSRLGPGVAWHDLDGDGRDELIIGSGQGGRMAVFRNTGDSNRPFVALDSDALNAPLTRDQTGLAAWTGINGQAFIVAGQDAFEAGRPAPLSAQVYTFENGRARLADGLAGGEASTGPIAVADVDGSGALAVFIGGRLLPGKYPAPAPSLLYRWDGGHFIPDENASLPFAAAGLVTSAIFTDLNGDGFPDLVLALEWGPITVFLNDGHGRFHDATVALGLASFTGWWNGVTAGDFDGDGRLDLAATNWGLNSKYEHRYDAGHPLTAYYGNFAEDGTTHFIECYFDPALGKLVPERPRDTLAAVLPWVTEKLPTHAAYSTAGVVDVFGERLDAAKKVTSCTLAHTVFLNRGDRFQPVPLPDEAQWSAAFGIAVADFDGDGHEDLALAQNFSAAQSETPRLDAGRGLILRGDGKGGFTALPASLSGIAAPGDGRGLAVCDYDADGCPDLALGQNGAATQLYRNTSAKPGLRVRLTGPPGNPEALGAQLRVIVGKTSGPVREIRAGNGYWSQDFTVAILALPEKTASLWVRWPGGNVTTTQIPAGVREITVSARAAK